MNSTLDFLTETGQTRVRSLPLWENPDAEKRPRIISFIAALMVHIFLFTAGGFAFVRPAEYGIELSDGGMEVSLIAALPRASAQGVQVRQPEITPEKSEMEMLTPLPQPAGDLKSAEENTSPAMTSEDSEYSGDGSSAVPGKSKTTFYSAGGGSVDAKAGYLKNPPPPYPQEAIAMGQEGLVLVSVTVSRTGRPKNVVLKDSSGYPLLDRSAVRAIKGWKFSPGKMGFLAADSQVVIPIRFRLEDVKSKKG